MVFIIVVDGSPQQVKAKQGVSARNRRTNGTKAVSKSKVTTNPAATPQSLQPVPDLWLEAKKTAEVSFYHLQSNLFLLFGYEFTPIFNFWCRVVSLCWFLDYMHTVKLV